MDEGIIYEEGSPEEIFNNPQKDKTRQFVHGLKVLYLNIDSKNYDFIEMTSQIETYCQKNQIPNNKTYHLQVIFEELCDQILIPEMGDVDIIFNVEYSPNDDRLFINAKYGNQRFNIEDAENKLSLNIIKGLVDKMEFKIIDEDYFINQLSLILK